MQTIRLAMTAIVFAASAWAQGATLQYPYYTSASVVNAASYSADGLAPNVIATIYGKNLSYDTHGLEASDLRDGQMPFSMAGVTVFIGGIQAGLYYVSPSQVNFLIPAIFTPSDVKISLGRDSVSGPTVTVKLHETAPSMFADTKGSVIAAHLDGSLIGDQTPAGPGEWIVLYGLGMGRTTPDSLAYALPEVAAPLTDLSQFSVTLDGAALDRSAIYYAGIAPGNAGLYQMNVKLPDKVSANPKIQISAQGVSSQTGLYLAAHGSL